MKRMIVVLASALALVAQAQAHVLNVKGSKTSQLQARIAHDRGVVRSVDRQAVHAGSWLLLEERLWLTRQWHVRDLARASRLLWQVWVPHRAGWLCLHRYESIDWHNQDTGHNGHFGGLQMSWGWLSLVSGNPANLTPLQQMQAAERGYHNSGYSRAWLAGQWTTYPLCARYF
jgi:hypothetical protein